MAYLHTCIATDMLAITDNFSSTVKISLANKCIIIVQPEVSIFFNVPPSPIYVLVITYVLQSCKLVCNLNLKPFPNLQLIQLPEIKSFHIKLLYYLFTYCQSFPHFCNHQIVISITASSPETSNIQYTRMPSPIYQHVIDLVVSLPIRRGPGVLMNVSMEEYHALNNQIF